MLVKNFCVNLQLWFSSEQLCSPHRTASRRTDVYHIDGRKAAGLAAKLNTGNSSVQLSLPKGIFIVKISGGGYSLSEKLISNSGSGIRPSIILSEWSGNSGTDHAQQKAKASTANTVSMTYAAIPNVTNNDTWWSLSTGAYCWYNNEVSYRATYGALYNWYAVNTGKLAPKGWHVPTDAEWTTLENYLIANGYNYDGSTTGIKIAKALASTTGWSTSTTAGAIGNDLTKNNRSGFTALPGGLRGSSGSGGTDRIGYWWSSTRYDAYDAWARYLGCYYGKYYGFSVRCVRD
ncbi:MAG: FISUMP domain-containing protein [Paludibacteraceae bacterium]